LYKDISLGLFAGTTSNSFKQFICLYLSKKSFRLIAFCYAYIFPSPTTPLCTQGSLLNQVAIANDSLGGGIVVVMAERDKEEMELDIAKMEFDFKGTSVICRSGSPLILADLKKVCLLPLFFC
jgi:hypothetical protein